MNNNGKLKALGMFVFAGSASIGLMNTGLFEVDKIIEISDEMLEQNAKHFIHNYPNIPVVPPSVWLNEEVQEGEYDILYGNCPCSGLSSLTRTRSVDNKANVHFYRMFDEIQRRKPKTFLIENSNNLISLGFPILRSMVNQLKEDYTFTIVRDKAANHGVAMQRTRTFVIGWRKDLFDGKIPLLHVNKKNKTFAKNVIEKYENYELGTNEITCHTLVPDRNDIQLEKFFKDVPHGCSIREHICRYWDNYVGELDEKTVKSFSTMLRKFNNGQSYWDKSPRRVHYLSTFPSMSSVANFIHPNLDRPLTIREYAAIMNYPDDFEFVEDAKVPVVQAISQGVPANFFGYIANEVGQALLGNRLLIDLKDNTLVYQNHINNMYRLYNLEEIEEAKCLDVTKKTSEGILLK